MGMDFLQGYYIRLNELWFGVPNKHYNEVTPEILSHVKKLQEMATKTNCVDSRSQTILTVLGDSVHSGI